ncbi:MAG: hypothetical protein P3A28_04710, partial [Gemmatimonadota bacterium]|nr:hypothetical protein [Gemmatimonadota bacterium]
MTAPPSSPAQLDQSRPAATGRGARVFSFLASPMARLPLLALAALGVTGTLMAARARWDHEIGVALLVLT